MKRTHAIEQQIIDLRESIVDHMKTRDTEATSDDIGTACVNAVALAKRLLEFAAAHGCPGCAAPTHDRINAFLTFERHCGGNPK